MDKNRASKEVRPDTIRTETAIEPMTPFDVMVRDAIDDIHGEMSITLNEISTFMPSMKHKHMLRDVRGMRTRNKNIDVRWIKDTTYKDKQGKTQPTFRLSSEGVMFVLGRIGATGEKRKMLNDLQLRIVLRLEEIQNLIMILQNNDMDRIEDLNKISEGLLRDEVKRRVMMNKGDESEIDIIMDAINKIIDKNVLSLNDGTIMGVKTTLESMFISNTIITVFISKLNVDYRKFNVDLIDKEEWRIVKSLKLYMNPQLFKEYDNKLFNRSIHPRATVHDSMSDHPRATVHDSSKSTNIETHDSMSDHPRMYLDDVTIVYKGGTYNIEGDNKYHTLDIIMNDLGRVVTIDSNTIAELMEMELFNLNRDIKTLIEDNPTMPSSWIQEGTYLDGLGREQNQFIVNANGFMFLIGVFPTPRNKDKRAYVEVLQARLIEQLRHYQHLIFLSFQDRVKSVRNVGMLNRRILTDAIKRLIRLNQPTHSIMSGRKIQMNKHLKDSERIIYGLITTSIYDTLGIPIQFQKEFRDKFNDSILETILLAESSIATYLATVQLLPNQVFNVGYIMNFRPLMEEIIVRQVGEKSILELRREFNKL